MTDSTKPVVHPPLITEAGWRHPVAGVRNLTQAEAAERARLLDRQQGSGIIYAATARNFNALADFLNDPVVACDRYPSIPRA